MSAAKRRANAARDSEDSAASDATVQGYAGRSWMAPRAALSAGSRRACAQPIGLVSFLLGIGAGLGLVVPGLILERLSYHWLFWLPLAVIALVTALIARYVPASPVRTAATINWSSAALMATGLAGLLVAGERGHDLGVGVRAHARSGQLTTTCLTTSARHGLPADRGFTLAFGVCAAALIVGLVTALIVPRARLGRAPAPVSARGARA